METTFRGDISIPVTRYYLTLTTIAFWLWLQTQRYYDNYRLLAKH